MATTKANKNKTNEGINAKSAADLKKRANEFHKTFKGACRALFELSEAGDKVAAKVCNYIGINADTITAKGISKILSGAREKLPVYYLRTIEEKGKKVKEIKEPAALKSIPSAAGFPKGAKIAVAGDWLTALIEIAVAISKKNEYMQYSVVPTTVAEIEEGELTDKDIYICLYAKSPKTGAIERLESEKWEEQRALYAKYLNAKKKARKEGKLAEDNALNRLLK